MVSDRRNRSGLIRRDVLDLGEHSPTDANRVPAVLAQEYLPESVLLCRDNDSVPLVGPPGSTRQRRGPRTRRCNWTGLLEDANPQKRENPEHLAQEAHRVGALRLRQAGLSW